MNEYYEKLKQWHGNTDVKWKEAMIEKANSKLSYQLYGATIDENYDRAIDVLTLKTYRPIVNLAKKMGYDKIPCLHCRNIIKYWNTNDEWKWNPDVAYLFKGEL